MGSSPESNCICAQYNLFLNLTKLRPLHNVNTGDNVMTLFVFLWFPVLSIFMSCFSVPPFLWVFLSCSGTVCLLSVAVSQFRVCILQRSICRPIMSQRHTIAVPIQRLLQMQPTSPSFFSLFLEDARLQLFVESNQRPYDNNTLALPCSMFLVFVPFAWYFVLAFVCFYGSRLFGYSAFVK